MDIQKHYMSVLTAETTNVFDSYMQFFNHYNSLYGSKIAVLMEVGKFYECFGLENSESSIQGNVSEMSTVMQLEITKSMPAKPPSNSNPLFCGFGTQVVDKYAERLLSKGYTVILVDQVKKGKDVYKRTTKQILTPGTFMGNSFGCTSQKIVCIYIENLTKGKTLERLKESNVKKLSKRESKWAIQWIWSKCKLAVGMASIDVSTNRSTVYEVCDRDLNESEVFDDIYRFLQANNPKEIEIHLEKFPFVDFGKTMQKEQQIEYLKDWIKSQLDLNQYLSYNIHVNETKKDYDDPKLQNKAFGKIFKDTGMLSPLQYLELSQCPLASLSLLLLYQFIYQRDESLLQKLEKPKWNEEMIYLILTHNAIKQLELIYSEKWTPLIKIVDKTRTIVGRRLLTERLLNPINKSGYLKQRYNLVQDFLDLSVSKKEQIDTYLKGICDLERFHRKLELSILTPADFVRLFQSYKNISKLLEFVKRNSKRMKHVFQISPSDEEIDQFNEIIKDIKMTFNLDVMKQMTLNKSIKQTFFKEGVNENVDSIYKKIKKQKKSIENVRKSLAMLVCKNGDSESLKKIVTFGQTDKTCFLKISNKNCALLKYYQEKTFGDTSKKSVRYTDPDEWIMRMKKEGKKVNNPDAKLKRNASLDDYENFGKKEYLSDEQIIMIKNLQYHRCKGYTKIFSEEVSKAVSIISKYENSIQEIVLKEYREYGNEMCKNNRNVLNVMIEFVSRLDVALSSADVASKNKYVRPTISKMRTIDSKGQRPVPSFIKASKIRHPVIERTHTDVEYVPNDVNLGVCDEFNNNGIILTGVNNCGKTSHLKAIGLNVVLAQAGLYVAASSFEFNPFKNIVTRLSGTDDPSKGQGQFAVEMTELQTIMSRSNENTLSLGDEICRGTEQDSALMIVAASIEKLAKIKTNFVFASHLHDLIKLDDIRKIENIKYYHLEVYKDPDTGILIYKRDLKEGPSLSAYGIECAEAMGLDKDVIKRAYELRKQHLGISNDIQSNKKSHFNSLMYLDKCGICKENTEEVHHIKHQADADKDGFIGIYHKNILHNLVGLCHKHHKMVHRNQIEIDGYSHTSKGIKLIYRDKN